MMTTDIRIPGLLLLFLAGLAMPLAAQAQSSSDSRIGRWYIGGGFGLYAEEDNSQLSNQDADAALFFSAGFRASANVAIEADGLAWRQDFTTPNSIVGQLPGAEGRTELTANGVGAVIKFIAPLNAIDLYAGGGLGFYAANLQVSGSSGTEIDETEVELGYQALLGADVYVSRRISVGLEYRWVKVDYSFDPYIVGNVDAGGQFFLMHVRGHF